MTAGQARSSNDNGPTEGRLVPVTQTVPALRDPYGGPAGYRGTIPEVPEPSAALNLLEYWRVVNKRKWLILSVAGAFLALGTVRTLMQTPLYTSTVRLQIDRNVAKVVEGGNVSPVESSDFEFLRTQYELLQSRTMAERVVSA